MARENAMTSAIGIGDPGSRHEYSTHLSAGTEAMSLLQLIDQRHNVVTYGTPSAGRETVGVPFNHVALLTSASGRLKPGSEARDTLWRTEST